MKRLYKKALVFLIVFIAIAVIAYGETPRLIIKDDSDNTVFEVADTGNMFAGGADAYNAFQLYVIGHTGGTSHAQIATGLANSRLTLMAGEADDAGPRFSAIGAHDTQSEVRGWAIFDYGSKKYALPDAEFFVRHQQSGGNRQIMFRIIGSSAVVFPNGNIGIGIDTPGYLIDTGGAYCDGSNWTDGSSREYKENIKDITTEEALKTLRDMTPVKFTFKRDTTKEINAGFIAEDVPDLVATKDRKGMNAIEVVAVLAKVLQEQQKTIAELTRRLEEVEKR